MTINDSQYIKVYSVNSLYFIFRNGYFEKSKKSNYLTLVRTDESKEKMKEYEKLCSKISGLTTSITKTQMNMVKSICEYNLIQLTSYL